MSGRAVGALLALGWFAICWALADGLSLAGLPAYITWLAMTGLGLLIVGLAYLWALSRDPAVAPESDAASPGELPSSAERETV